jgi:DNA-binding MarR family transcriptional regulator
VNAPRRESLQASERSTGPQISKINRFIAASPISRSGCASTVNVIDESARARDDVPVAGNDLGRLLLEAHRAIASELDASLEERGYPDLRPGHAAVFLNIDRRAGTRLTELARRARMTKQGMMLVVDDLEERGYVRRVPDVEDARAKVVRLTARGRRCAAEARRAVQAIETRVRRQLGDRAYELLRESLEELIVWARESSDVEP